MMACASVPSLGEGLIRVDIWGTLASLTSLISKFQTKGRACLNKTNVGSI